MTDLVVIVPSRGRPEAARELVQAFADTCTADTFIWFAIDDNDPTRDEYVAISDGRRSATMVLPSRTMVEALNMATSRHGTPQCFAVGFMGDDHRPRTVGWDTAYLAALRELGTGIVYGDDLLQGERLPTQCAMTADIVRALGFMAPPTLRHMYVDNFWLDLGRVVGCIRYLSGVVVEHMHPVVGKAEVDAGYERVNAPDVYDTDGRAYAAYGSGPMVDDVAKVRALRASLDGESIGRALRQGINAATEHHEWRLFDEGTVPEYTKPEWYAGREHAPHLEQPGHRERLMLTAQFVALGAFGRKVDTVVDLGSGDGGLLSLLGPALTGWGYDLMPENLDAAKVRGVDVRYGDVVAGDIEWGQIAVCTEMLEHLVDPHAFVRRIAQHAEVLVCSSPWMERPGAAYEFHTWCFDLDGYRALVEQAGFKVQRQQRVHSFQVILAVRP